MCILSLVTTTYSNRLVIIMLAMITAPKDTMMTIVILSLLFLK